MEAAITFAETGHLCLGTLHSNNANQSIERIMNFFPGGTARANLSAVVVESTRHHLSTADAIPGREAERLRSKSCSTRLALKTSSSGRGRFVERSDGAGVEEGCQTFDHVLLQLYKAGEDFSSSKP